MSFQKNPNTLSRADALALAYTIADQEGFLQLSRNRIAARSGMAKATVSFVCGDMPAVRAEVMRRAVELGNCQIVLAGLALRDPVALAAPQSLKLAALNLG